MSKLVLLPMAEKTTLIDKLPPTAKADTSVASTQTTPPANTPSNQTKTAAKTLAKPATKTTPATSNENSDQSVEAVVAVDSTPPPTITSLERVTYYSFILDAIIWGCIGLFLFGKAFKDKQKVSFASMATYGGLLIAVGFMFFLNSKTFYSYLIDVSSEPGFALRGFCWMIFAPTIFYIISRLIRMPAQDKKLYLTMFGLAAGLFLFIGLSQMVSSRMEQIGLSVFPFLFSGSLAMLMFMTLGKGASALRGQQKRGVSVIVYVVIGSWFLYPVINLLSHLTSNLTLYSLSLNVIDLVMLSGLTFGLWNSMAARSERIQFNASFSKARKNTPSPYATKDTEAELDVERGNGTAKPKPSLKRPSKIGNN